MPVAQDLAVLEGSSITVAVVEVAGGARVLDPRRMGASLATSSWPAAAPMWPCWDMQAETSGQEGGAATSQVPARWSGECCHLPSPCSLESTGQGM